jgi:hypothetical protein
MPPQGDVPRGLAQAGLAQGEVEARRGRRDRGRHGEVERDRGAGIAGGVKSGGGDAVRADGEGLAGGDDFTVRDSTAPTLALTAAPPATVEASSAAGAAVSLASTVAGGAAVRASVGAVLSRTVKSNETGALALPFAASAGDGVDPAPRVVFRAGDTVVSSGQTFAIGTHSVTATAFDRCCGQGQRRCGAVAHRKVERDRGAGIAGGIKGGGGDGPATVEASSAAGAAVSFTAIAGDGVDPAPRVVFRAGDTARGRIDAVSGDGGKAHGGTRGGAGLDRGGRCRRQGQRRCGAVLHRAWCSGRATPW